MCIRDSCYSLRQLASTLVCPCFCTDQVLFGEAEYNIIFCHCSRGSSLIFCRERPGRIGNRAAKSYPLCFTIIVWLKSRQQVLRNFITGSCSNCRQKEKSLVCVDVGTNRLQLPD